MTEVAFYHLTDTPLEATLPVMLERSLERGWRVRIRGVEMDRLGHLDRHLWSYTDTGFLPHGLANGKHDSAQPILLTDKAQNDNSADVLMLIDGASEDLHVFSDYKRVCIMFDGHDADAVALARDQWKAVTASKMSAAYWAQDNGKWVNKA